MKTLKISMLPVLLTIFILMGVTWVFAQGNEIIHACVAKDGALRIVALDGQCKSKETSLSWNIQGEQGPPGVLGFYTITSEVNVPSQSLNFGTTARCDLGDVVTGGGYHYVDYEDGVKSEVGVGGVVAMVDRPAEPQDGLGEGWKVNVESTRPSQVAPVTLEVIAICADLTP